MDIRIFAELASLLGEHEFVCCLVGMWQYIPRDYSTTYTLDIMLASKKYTPIISFIWLAIVLVQI
jgi:hypothetical protein